MGNLIRILNIQKFLNREACQILVQGLVMSHLDYANSMLIDVPDATLKPFTRVQALAAKTIFRRTQSNSVSDCL